MHVTSLGPRLGMWRRRAALHAVGLALAFTTLVQAQPTQPLAVMRDDARLRSITFIDPDRGWAVGDRGTVWRTVDGGRSWQLQDVGTQATLHHIHFADARHGWIAGAAARPYTHETEAVLLRTIDGGETWSQSPGLILPGLKRVRFFNPREGVAIGNGSSLYPSGIFRSTDGGRSWTPMTSDGAQHWTAGDFVNLEQGAVAGYVGKLGIVAYGRSNPSRTPPLGPRTLRDLHLDGPTGWLVGDGGLVMRTEDGGASWQFPPTPLPAGAGDYFDFRTIATLGPHTWLAGAPGSIVFHTPDGGRTWNRFTTGQSLPIDDLVMLDERRGWAVGSMGTILATRDGGRTWRPARAPARRAALLGLFARFDDMPWELLVQYCASEGYRGAVEQLLRPPAGTMPLAAPAPQRLEQAAVIAGASEASAAWEFASGPAGLALPENRITQRWDQENDGQGRERMLELMVRRIRQWRPDVIITEPIEREMSDAASRQLTELAIAAAQQAGDPTAFPDHASLAGLEPWRVNKVFARTSAVSSATVRLSTYQLAPNLGSSLSDVAAPAHGLAHREFQRPPTELGLRLLVDRLPQNAGRADVFSGLHLPPGSDARRMGMDALPGDLNMLGRIAQQRQNVEKMIARAGDEGAAWLGQIADLTRDFKPSTSGVVLFQLAQQYRSQGRGELAADVLQRLVRDYPDHDLAGTALVWLVQYYASSEMAWRQARTTRFQSQVVAAEVDPQAIAAMQAGGSLPETGTTRAVLAGPATHAPAAATLDRRSRAPQAIEIATLVARTRPTLYADPELRFPLSVCQRELGMSREAEQLFHQLASSSSDAAWQLAAQGELWLRHGTGAAPKPVVTCMRAPERPRLDGDLSDAIWQAARPMTLAGPTPESAPWKTEVKLAYDELFLYVAARCERAPDCEYPKSGEPRPRDPDLSARDRIEILLDVDRDYASYYRLTIDHRGWPRDECWGDLSWDPQWFVAQSEDGQSWTVEAAIPWIELAAEPPAPQTAWAVGLQRIAPQAGLQAWTWPAAVTPQPKGFGIVVFE